MKLKQALRSHPKGTLRCRPTTYPESAAIRAKVSLTEAGRRYLRKPAYIIRSLATVLSCSIIMLRVPSLPPYADRARTARCSLQHRSVQRIRGGTLRATVCGRAEYCAALWRMTEESPLAWMGRM
jgi:hypothetical protein